MRRCPRCAISRHFLRHPVPLLALTFATGCGTEVTVIDGDASPPTPFDATLELVEGPTNVLANVGGARVVARSGGFDVVSGDDDVIAQRVEVTGAPPYLRIDAPRQTLEEGVLGFLIATARE